MNICDTCDKFCKTTEQCLETTACDCVNIECCLCDKQLQIGDEYLDVDDETYCIDCVLAMEPSRFFDTIGIAGMLRLLNIDIKTRSTAKGY